MDMMESQNSYEHEASQFVSDSANLSLSKKNITKRMLECRLCQQSIGKGKYSIKCHSCSGLFHFECTRLPPYMLYSLSTSKRQYICEECTNTPEEFLVSIIDKNMQNLSPTVKEDKILDKINEIQDFIEKYNLHDIVDTLNNLNSKITENFGKLDKKISSFERIVHDWGKREPVVHTDETAKSKIDLATKEIRSIKAAEKLLLKACTEKEKKIKQLIGERETYIKKINDSHSKIQKLESEKERSRAQQEESTETEELKATNENVTKDLKNAIEKISDLKEINTALKKQISTYADRVTSLERKSEIAPEVNGTLPPTKTPIPPIQRQAILMHDSLCGKINDTLCSKENVSVKKVWAPNLSLVLDELDKIENDVDVIVFHSMTNDLKDKNEEDIVKEMIVAVEKGLLKSKKIVISLIVKRDDDEMLNMKATVINAKLRLHFSENPDVILSNNENLKDRSFRHDRVHLTEFGISRLANNLKFKIATSLGIHVVKKRVNDQRTIYKRFDSWGRHQHR